MHTPTLSVRLPGEVRERLEQAARHTNRSRSFLVQEALTRHLDDIMREQKADETKSRLEKLCTLKGAGARLYGPRSEEDITAQIREFRGDE
jgi:predicted DNA-binding protein